MDILNQQSRQSIYFSVSYVISSPWSVDAVGRLDFQKALADQKLDFPQTRAGIHDFILLRNEPSQLQVKAASLGPAVSSISISSDRPANSLEYFCKEADAVCGSYRQTWLKEQFQILRCKATIRHLYSCSEHAFKCLWEDRLGQDPKDFRFLGDKPVLGGGLRFVMPPISTEKEPVQIEIKIESFFRESNKFFIETIFEWPKPRVVQAEGKFDPAFRLTTAEKYAVTKVCDFLNLPDQLD